jgi:hypothetical protein
LALQIQSVKRGGNLKPVSEKTCNLCRASHAHTHTPHTHARRKEGGAPLARPLSAMADKKIQSTSKLLKAYNEIDAALKKATQAAGVRACVRVWHAVVGCTSAGTHCMASSMQSLAPHWLAPSASVRLGPDVATICPVRLYECVAQACFLYHARCVCECAHVVSLRCIVRA